MSSPDGGDSRTPEGVEAGSRINVGGGDDQVVRIQLAARWAEAFSPKQGDSLGATLHRFRVAYDYLDAVTHGIEPAQLEEDKRPTQRDALPAQGAPAPEAASPSTPSVPQPGSQPPTTPAPPRPSYPTFG